MKTNIEPQRGLILESLGPSITHKEDISTSSFFLLLLFFGILIAYLTNTKQKELQKANRKKKY